MNLVMHCRGRACYRLAGDLDGFGLTVTDLVWEEYFEEKNRCSSRGKSKGCPVLKLSASDL